MQKWSGYQTNNNNFTQIYGWWPFISMANDRAARAAKVSLDEMCAHGANGSEAHIHERRPLHPRLRARRHGHAGREQLVCSLRGTKRSASKSAAKVTGKRVDLGAVVWLLALARG